MEHLIVIALGIWSALLTAFVGVVGFIAREKNTKLKDLEQMLINTKLEVARDNVTQAEMDKITAHIDQRFNKLEAKIDQLIQKGLTA
jgi:hypothetical protein